MIEKWLKKIFPVFFITAIGLVGLISFFHVGFFPSHDGEWMVVRFSDFHRSLADGQWPVRWAGRLNFGFGYPVFDFLYPGTFYFTEVFHVFKLNFVNSVKMAFVISYLLSGLFMYLFAKQWWGKLGGLAAAVLYLFTPYRFVDMYVRGSLGESVAFMFPPLIFLAITKIYFSVILSVTRNLLRMRDSSNKLRDSSPAKRVGNDKKKIWIAVGAVGVAGLITTHNVIAYLFLPIVILFILFLHFTSSRVKNGFAKQNLLPQTNMFTVYCLLFTVLGIAASTFFWLPALWDKQYTIFDKVLVADFSKNFPSFKELILPFWGYGPSRPGDPGSMSFQIGIVNIVIVLMSLFIIIINKLKQKVNVIPTDPPTSAKMWRGAEKSYSTDLICKRSLDFARDDNKIGLLSVFFLAVTFFAIFFITPFSQSLWKIIPGLSLIQFPWRILSVTTFASAFLAGYAVSVFKKRGFVLAMVIIIAALILNYNYVKPSQFINRGEGYYTTNDDTTTVQNEYTPIWANNLPRQRPENKIEIVKGAGNISGILEKSNKTQFIYEGNGGVVKINTLYFPGWEAFVNGQKKNIIISKQGLITLKLQDGKSLVEFKFTETPVRRISDTISLFSLFCIVVLFISSMSSPRRRESII
ncbi:MAG: hypothetical protein M1120_02870 [Patescibacteria group bacterium]|nr:hypothetical protein [Patescibacteria group bacterium]